MRRGITTLIFLLAAAPPGATAQSAGGAPAAEQNQLLGMRLFNQSCRVCHVRPQATSPQYAPVLSKDTLGGNADALRQFIGNGTARMPGFRSHFQPSEIDAIVAYIKTVGATPPPAASSGPAVPGSASREAD